jgi:hypothetical protein
MLRPRDKAEYGMKRVVSWTNKAGNLSNLKKN